MQQRDQRNLDKTLLEPLEICGRPTNVGALHQFSLLPQFTCPASSSSIDSSPYDGSTAAADNSGVSPYDVQITNPPNVKIEDSTTNPDIINNNKPNMLLLSGTQTFGRTGNNLIEFLHALQVARDKDLVLGIMHGSWAMQVLMSMFLAINGDDWEKKWEEAFCGEFFFSELLSMSDLNLFRDSWTDHPFWITL